MTIATVEARANIALVKYWGKRDVELNLPAAGSLSLTLDGLTTRTSVEIDGALTEDVFVLGGEIVGGEPAARVTRLLDLVRARAFTTARARVVSDNDFPTASGLASSASAFAALALAATHAFGIELPPGELSALARRGSGSAARSIFGGFVELSRDGSASQLIGEDEWDLRLVVAVVGEGQKPIGSRDGMGRTAATSPLYAGWLASVDGDLAAARHAIAARDLAALGEVAERSALTMHASALAARPGVVYWRGATVDALHEVRRLRAGGVPVWATIDAGPHLKALCATEAAGAVAIALAGVPGVTATRICRPGAGARLVTR